MSCIVYCLRNLWFFRLHASTIEELLKRGHEVHVAVFGDDSASADPQGLKGAFDRLREFQTVYPNLFYDEIIRKVDRWAVLNMIFNRLIDFFHFRRKFFKEHVILWERIKGPRFLQPYLRWSIWHNQIIVAIACRLLRAMERSLPPERKTLKYFKIVQPDLVAFSPLTDTALSQFDQLRAAHCVGVPTAFLVNSWDNLSSKSWVRHKVDKVIVWNEIQKREAIDLHGVLPEHIVITGTPSFDDIFDFEPSETREGFYARVGMDQNQPYILYVGTAVFQRTGRPERLFFEDWLASIRTHPDKEIRNLQIIVRPHPARAKDWVEVEKKQHGGIFFWPAVYEFPVHGQGRSDYLHSIYYSLALVGINTSAFWEGAILGRPVLTVLDSRFQESQTQTVHFDYLCPAKGGILRSAENLSTHLDQLVKVVYGQGDQTEAERNYMISFLCPRASEGTASILLRDELESILCKSKIAIRNNLMRRLFRKLFLSPLSHGTYKYYRGTKRLNKDLKLRAPVKVRN